MRAFRNSPLFIYSRAELPDKMMLKKSELRNVNTFNGTRNEIRYVRDSIFVTIGTMQRAI